MGRGASTTRAASAEALRANLRGRRGSGDRDGNGVPDWAPATPETPPPAPPSFAVASVGGLLDDDTLITRLQMPAADHAQLDEFVDAVNRGEPLPPSTLRTLPRALQRGAQIADALADPQVYATFAQLERRAAQIAPGMGGALRAARLHATDPRVRMHASAYALSAHDHIHDSTQRWVKETLDDADTNVAELTGHPTSAALAQALCSAASAPTWTRFAELNDQCAVAFAQRDLIGSLDLAAHQADDVAVVDAALHAPAVGEAPDGYWRLALIAQMVALHVHHDASNAALWERACEYAARVEYPIPGDLRWRLAKRNLLHSPELSVQEAGSVLDDLASASVLPASFERTLRARL